MLDSSDWTSPICFEPGIDVHLGGTLELQFAEGVDVSSQAGRIFHLFDWTGVQPQGEFKVQSPWIWDLSQFYQTGDVRLVPEPGAALGAVALAATLARRRPNPMRADVRSGKGTGKLPR
ncbi:MAG TPA: hypothetical protein VHP11_02995 [Tepidisphaeraceae bacterium]|nr:hypothetical protein [Tepidisphaeraceae bacterium]